MVWKMVLWNDKKMVLFFLRNISVTTSYMLHTYFFSEREWNMQKRVSHGKPPSDKLFNIPLGGDPVSMRKQESFSRRHEEDQMIANQWSTCSEELTEVWYISHQLNK